LGFENKLLEGITLVDADIIFPTHNDAGVNKGHPSRCCVRNNKNRVWIKDSSLFEILEDIQATMSKLDSEFGVN
tara:strand:+ start:420 stop:641 length:222 start_codon:yes stop_codon:yes gene_type:complete